MTYVTWSQLATIQVWAWILTFLVVFFYFVFRWWKAKRKKVTSPWDNGVRDFGYDTHIKNKYGRKK